MTSARVRAGWSGLTTLLDSVVVRADQLNGFRAHAAAILRELPATCTSSSSVVAGPASSLDPLRHCRAWTALLEPERRPRRTGGCCRRRCWTSARWNPRPTDTRLAPAATKIAQRRCRPPGRSDLQPRPRPLLGCDLRGTTWSGMGTDWLVPQAEQAACDNRPRQDRRPQIADDARRWGLVRLAAVGRHGGRRKVAAAAHGPRPLTSASCALRN